MSPATNDAAILAPATMRLQAAATISIYDWNRELIHWYETRRDEGFNRDLLPLWAKLRSNRTLLQTFVDTAFYQDLKSQEYSWPAPLIVTAGDVSIDLLQTALGTSGRDLNDWFWPLSECIRVRYDQATLESPLSARRQASLQDMNIDEFRAHLPITGTVLCRRNASFTVDMTLTVGEDPHWEHGLLFMPRGTTRERLWRVWREIQRHPELFTGLRLDYAIWKGYEDHGLDDGHFSQILKRFALTQRSDLEEYQQFKPVLENLPLDDQRWHADVCAGKHGDGFGAIVGFVLHFMHIAIAGTTLSMEVSERLSA